LYALHGQVRRRVFATKFSYYDSAMLTDLSKRFGWPDVVSPGNVARRAALRSAVRL
jgi:hypothetical protein